MEGKTRTPGSAPQPPSWGGGGLGVGLWKSAVCPDFPKVGRRRILTISSAKRAKGGRRKGLPCSGSHPVSMRGPGQAPGAALPL